MTIDGEKVRKLMESKYGTIVSLAEASKVHRNTISEIINGQKPNPNLDTINKLAKALKVDPKKLLMGD